MIFPAHSPSRASRPSRGSPICSILVRPMNARIATAILLVACPFAAALADTKVVLPHSQRFADTGRDFLLETTIPGDFKTLEGIVWGVAHIVIAVPGQTVLLIFFSRCLKLHLARRRCTAPLHVLSRFAARRQEGNSSLHG